MVLGKIQIRWSVGSAATTRSAVHNLSFVECLTTERSGGRQSRALAPGKHTKK